ARREAELREGGRAAELVAHAPVIDDVVAVRAAGHRGKERRGVDVADPERGQVPGERRRVREREVAVELEAVGRARRPATRHAATPRATALPAAPRLPRRTPGPLPRPAH